MIIIITISYVTVLYCSYDVNDRKKNILSQIKLYRILQLLDIIDKLVL